MSILSSLGTRAAHTPAYPLASQSNAGKSGRAHTGATTGGGSDGGSGGDPVSLSTDAILQNRAASLGSATVDFAQNLLTSFTQQVLGDAAKGDTVSFDSVSLDTSSSFAIAAQHSAGANGSTDSVAAGLSDSSHFIGKGTITTTDGRKFDFEIEVQYDDKIEAGVSQSNGGASSAAAPDNAADSGAAAPAQSGAPAANSGGDAAASPSDNSALPTIQLPNIDFGGGLADLFQLIGRQLQTNVQQHSGSGSGKSDGGAADSIADPFKTLSLRLLKLVDSIKEADIYAPATSNGNAKSLAGSYDATGAGGSGAAATATPAADAPATAAASSATANASSPDTATAAA
ncbi:hypothetical protein [Rugamonas sp.]|uniref:hypothetical protein n=1 Tax=Rugamonas sp. TaxID=1926287 RepID=UPI0025FD031A|nr:hypothetical protein [Rugamonas sp.]